MQAIWPFSAFALQAVALGEPIERARERPCVANDEDDQSPASVPPAFWTPHLGQLLRQPYSGVRAMCLVVGRGTLNPLGWTALSHGAGRFDQLRKIAEFIA